MKFIEFIKPNRFKIFLTSALIIVGPVPIYLLVLMGFLPPAVFLLGLVQSLARGEFGAVLFFLIVFLIHLIITHIISSILFYVFNGIRESLNKNNIFLWSLISIFIICLSIFSLTSIYSIGLVSSGTESGNIFHFYGDVVSDF